MEGFTDESFRLAVIKSFGGWQHYFTDFLRVPTVGNYPDRVIIDHFGKECFKNQELKNQTVLQLLTTPIAQTEYTVKQINGLGFKWVDLNLGCPSRKVNKNGGGISLVTDLKVLKQIIQSIRKNFKYFLSCKVRLGIESSINFSELLDLLESEGVNLITVHPRTKKQLYHGKANWNYIHKAVQQTNIPIIGNGDLQNLEDIKKMFNSTECHSVMIGRGALKRPWIAHDYKNNSSPNTTNEKILIFYKHFLQELNHAQIKDRVILQRFKAMSHYMLEDAPKEWKKSLLKQKSITDFNEHLSSLEL